VAKLDHYQAQEKTIPNKKSWQKGEHNFLHEMQARSYLFECFNYVPNQVYQFHNRSVYSNTDALDTERLV
jgi:hypothetical protein